MSQKDLPSRLAEFADQLDGHASSLDGQRNELQAAAMTLGRQWNMDATTLTSFCLSEAAALRAMAIELRRIAGRK